LKDDEWKEGCGKCKTRTLLPYKEFEKRDLGVERGAGAGNKKKGSDWKQKSAGLENVIIKRKAAQGTCRTCQFPFNSSGERKKNRNGRTED